MGEAQYEQPLLYIAGQWREGRSGRSLVVLNPADENTLAELPLADPEDIDEAIAAAHTSFADWRRTSPFERAAILKRAAALMGERRERLAEIMTLEQGKPLLEAGMEIDRSAETFEWYAEEATRINETVYAPRPPPPVGFQQRRVPEPVGVVAALTAWNFPSILVSRKLAPALAAGCTVILKAAEETPASAVAMVRILEEAGLPPGVLNLVFGEPDQVSTRLLDSALVRKLSFTGSVPVGKLLAAKAAKHLVRCTFELGGHAPVIVLPDADPAQVAAQTCAFKFRNAGQVCITASRFFVHESIHDEVLARFVEQAKALKVGDGREEGVQMGPMANLRRIEAMGELVEDAVAKGAKLMTGGERLGNRGYFFPPTVLADVPDAARIMREEPFGPVAPFVSFAAVEEAISRANALEYGLAAYVFGQDQRAAEQVGEALEAGVVGVNVFTPMLADTPAGGVKSSGYGYEGGRAGLEAYLQYKLISVPAN
jgi:acyl-CoA reductase-like NAD-dependent aldehyde dehydrogenase